MADGMKSAKVIGKYDDGGYKTSCTCVDGRTSWCYDDRHPNFGGSCCISQCRDMGSSKKQLSSFLKKIWK